jgi:hypothetical protein
MMPAWSSLAFRASEATQAASARKLFLNDLKIGFDQGEVGCVQIGPLS